MSETDKFVFLEITFSLGPELSVPLPFRGLQVLVKPTIIVGSRTWSKS